MPSFTSSRPSTTTSFTSSHKRTLGTREKEDNDLNLSIYPIGKYKGKTYIDIFKQDTGYLNWAINVKEPSGELRNLVEWYD